METVKAVNTKVTPITGFGKSGLNKDLGPFLVPVAVLVIIAILSATFGRYLLNNLLLVRGQIQKTKQENQTLTEKKNKLNTLDRALLTQEAQATILAIPTHDSALAAVATIRSQAFAKNVQLVSVRVSQSETQGKTQEVFLKFEVSGPLSNILALVDSLGGSAPILRISKVHMLGGSSQLSAALDLSTFWSQLSQKNPDPKAPFEALNKKEEELVAEIEKLKPASASTVVPAPAVNKENPF